jgi:hypothetical protein
MRLAMHCDWQIYVRESKGNICCFGTGREILVSVTIDSGRNMYGSKPGEESQICEEFKHMSSDNPRVFP